jgi:hypothetical protein
MKKAALLPLAVSLLLGLAMPSCQQPTEASAQGKRPVTKSKRGLLAGALGGSITVLTFPTDQDVYIAPTGHVNPGDTSRLMRQEYFAGRTPLQVTRPAVNYYVVVKQSPADSYLPDGEWHRLYVLPDKADLTKMLTDAKVYSVIHDDAKRSLVSSLVWPASMTAVDFMKAMPSEALLTVPDQDVARIRAVFQKNGVPEQDWERLFTLLRTTGRTVWHGEKSTNISAYYCAFGARGEAQELRFFPANLE